MQNADNIQQEFANVLDPYHLLKHPFYQAWTDGMLTTQDLGCYSAQYFRHVDAFPRYISTIHSKCENIQDRQVLLENLIDEERGEANHPKLWLDFAKSLGVSEESVRNSTIDPKTKALVDGFFEMCNSSYEEGLGALYTYERQVPEVAKTKIKGLKELYNLDTKDATEFFRVHIGADEWHSQEVADLIAKLPADKKERAKAAAIRAAKLLWGFLDGMEEVRLSKNYCVAANQAATA